MIPTQHLAPSDVGIVFDLDNTLVASHIDFAGMRRTVIDELVKANLALTGEQTRWPVGRLADLARLPDAPADLYSRLWAYIEAFEVAGMESATLEAGAKETLQTLHRRGHALGVLTNNSRSSAYAVLQAHNIQHMFDVILCREDVPRLKPAPDGLRVAAAALGKPRRLIMVGDSWIDGVAATQAGALFIAVGSWREGPEPCSIWAKASTLHDLLVVDLLKVELHDHQC